MRVFLLTWLSIPFWSDFINCLDIYIAARQFIFQSHFGLILSDFFQITTARRNETFNPILVWFYREIYGGESGRFLNALSIPFWSDFIGWSMFTMRRTCSFQSHFGLILSRGRLWREWLYQELSIPFWSDFIGNTDEQDNGGYESFQSHFGLILSYFTFRKESVQNSSFNPILVWFYPVKEAMRYPNCKSLSIPFWSDFIPRLLLQQRYILQSFNPILVWFYHSRHFGVSTWKILSIPFWSDFILRHCRFLCISCKIFQSHFGLILSINAKGL